MGKGLLLPQRKHGRGEPSEDRSAGSRPPGPPVLFLFLRRVRSGATAFPPYTLMPFCIMVCCRRSGRSGGDSECKFWHVIGAQVCVRIRVHPWAQSCPTLCDPMDCSPPGSAVHGILKARILEWVAVSSSAGSSHPRDQTCISCVSYSSRRILYHKHQEGSLNAKVQNQREHSAVAVALSLMG